LSQNLNLVYHRSYGVLEIASALIHVLVFLAIYRFNNSKKQVGPQTFVSFQKLSALLKIDSQSLFSFSLNMFCIFILASTTIFGPKLSKEKLEKINIFPNYLTVYYNALIAPGLISAISIILVYSRNKNLRKTIFHEVKNVVLNCIC
jgi:hypothetical protein